MSLGVIIVIVLAVYIIHNWKRMSEEEELGCESDEKRLIATAVRTRSSGVEHVIPLYAYYDISIPSKYYKKKNCLYYAIGVSEEQIYVTQFHVEEGSISFGKTNVIRKRDLRWIEGNDGYACIMGFVFEFINHKKFVFYLDESNVKVDEKCKVNIQQKEEMQEAYEIIRRWMKEVNQMKEPSHPALRKTSRVFYTMAKISLVIGLLGLITCNVCDILVKKGMPFAEIGRYSTIAISMGFFLAVVGGLFGLIFEAGGKGYL